MVEILIEERGKLTFDGEKLQCNICGRWYRHLGQHVVKAHGWLADDYREEFELNRGQELCVPELSEVFRQNAIERGGVPAKYRFAKPPKYKHPPMRLQALLKQSESKKGRLLTEKEILAGKLNLEKAKRLVSCYYCGKPTVTTHRKGNSICPDCLKVHKAALQKERWNKRRESGAGPLPKHGRIETDGERVQCHVCGVWLKCLAPCHIALHNMTADDYREEFGLNHTQPLCGKEHSEWCSRHIVEIGINGKFGSVEKMREAAEGYKGRPMRLQARLTNSDVRKGKPVKMTPARAISQKENARKALRPMDCEMCGTTVMRNKSTKHAYCARCLPIHRSQYMRDYHDDNAERLRKYWHDYDKKRRQKIAVYYCGIRHEKKSPTIG